MIHRVAVLKKYSLRRATDSKVPCAYTTHSSKVFSSKRAVKSINVIKT